MQREYYFEYINGRQIYFPNKKILYLYSDGYVADKYPIKLVYDVKKLTIDKEVRMANSFN